MQAEARRMLDPSVGRDAINLDKFKPIELPDAVYQDPMAPAVGPPPKMGAMQSTLGIGDVLPGAALSGVVAGMGTYTAFKRNFNGCWTLGYCSWRSYNIIGTNVTIK